MHDRVELLKEKLDQQIKIWIDTIILNELTLITP